jgi:eukaryotic-like serine/threonine-protein kinase
VDKVYYLKVCFARTNFSMHFFSKSATCNRRKRQAQWKRGGFEQYTIHWAATSVLVTAMPIQPGDNIGDYEVLSPLGSGGIGEVYKVRHVISQRTEAMKLLRPDRTASELSERFLREIRVLASLSHPHIARLNTAFKVDDQIAMVMEFIEGEDLHWKLRSKWAGRAVEGIEYIRQVLSALEYAHTRDVIHRDIKPSNIMITAESQAKLLDFGMAFKAADLSVTRPGFILGSLHYMSPEQVRGERVDARSDLYSTGVTLYEIVTGRRPFDGSTEYEVMTGHLQEMPKWPSDVNPAIPYSLSVTLQKALAKDPAARFQSAAQFLNALTHVSLDEAATLQTLAIQPGCQGSSSDPAKTPMGSPVGKTGSGSGGTGTRRFDPALLDSVSKELAVFIGPIAKVVVKRAAERCSSVEDLYGAVAVEIGSEKDRSSFLSRKRRM